MTSHLSSSKQELHIDLETRSEVDLKACGVYRYTHDPSFGFLLMAYSWGDDGEVEQIDFSDAIGDPDYVRLIPPEIREAILNPRIRKIAHNANFERTCFAVAMNRDIPPEQWTCTAVRAASCGLPRSLSDVGDALGMPEDKKKLATGHALIRYFCSPCKPTESNGRRRWNLPQHEPERWQLFKVYNKQDVVTEREVDIRLRGYPETIPEEHKLWCTDQRMNDAGVLADLQLVNHVLTFQENRTAEIMTRAREITGLDNPNSMPKVKAWVASKLKVDAITKLDKAAVTKMLQDLEKPEDADDAIDDPEIAEEWDETQREKEIIETSRALVRDDAQEDVVEFLRIRQQLGKTSLSKYDAIARSACEDHRIRGMLLFYGASRTGRWAGRLVQLQNLPQNHIKDIEVARDLIRSGDTDIAEMTYPSMSDLCSQLIRTTLIPREGHTFAVADYSAIEARVIAWLANAKWKMDIFARGGKIYEEAASRIFKIPVAQITKESEERKKGKIAELAGGYGGGVEAYKKMGADKAGLSDEEIKKLVYAWRDANPEIVNLWESSRKAMHEAVKRPGALVRFNRGVTFQIIKDTLFATLPSGRAIAYRQPEIRPGQFGGPEITYMGENAISKKWERIRTYGGRIVENLVQSIARDCLGAAILNLEAAGYRPQFHVHDEVIVEVPDATAEADLKKIQELMTLKEKPWTKDLVLTADGYLTKFYMKD